MKKIKIADKVYSKEKISEYAPSEIQALIEEEKDYQDRINKEKEEYKIMMKGKENLTEYQQTTRGFKLANKEADEVLKELIHMKKIAEYVFTNPEAKFYKNFYFFAKRYLSNATFISIETKAKGEKI